MGDSFRYKDWFNKAQKDLESAKILFKYNGDNAIISFHCQQSIEKAMKGFILARKSELIEGHSLIYLCKISSNLDPNIKSFLKECAYVNQFYIETRYPADIPLSIESDEAEECISIAEKILQYLTNK